MKITIEISAQLAQPQGQRMLIPYHARIVWYINKQNRLKFAYLIDGVLWTPIVAEMKRFAAMYGTHAYKPLSEYMRGEEVELLQVCL